MSQKIIDILIVVFFGIFGVHKFIEKNYKMGVLYLLTGGLFGVGWIVDIVKTIAKPVKRKEDSIMGKEGIDAINSGKLPSFEGTNLNLEKDEICCYMDSAYTYEDETSTTGYEGKYGGVNLNLIDKVSYNTGNNNAKAVKETNRITYSGILYITTKRIIYMSKRESFNVTFDKITSVQDSKDGIIIIQIESKTYYIGTNTHEEFMKVYNMVKD